MINYKAAVVVALSSFVLLHWHSGWLLTLLIILALPFMLFTVLPFVIWNLAKWRGLKISPLSRSERPFPQGGHLPFKWSTMVEQRRSEREPFRLPFVIPPEQDADLSKSLEHLIYMVMLDYVWHWFPTVSPVYQIQSEPLPSKSIEQYELHSPKDLIMCSLERLRQRVPLPPKPPVIRYDRDPFFVNTIEHDLRQILFAFKTRLEAIDPVLFITSQAVPILTNHIAEYKKALMVLNQSGRRHLTRSSDFDLILAGTYRNGRLHPALGVYEQARRRSSNMSLSSTPISPNHHTLDLLSGKTPLPTQTTVFECAYLRNVVQNQLFPALLPPHVQASKMMSTILREILVSVIIQPIMQMLADPDYWNQTMDQIATNIITEQKMVKKLREALERPFTKRDEDGIVGEESRLFGTASKSALPTFDEYVNGIKECNSLLDVKRIRNALVTEIRRKRLEIMDKKDKDTVNGRRVEDIKRYIHRLTMAKRRAEKRILQLGGVLNHRSASQTSQILTTEGQTFNQQPRPSESWNTSLNELLVEPGLTYFREYMEQIALVPILQFWLLIEAVKYQYMDPLTAQTSAGDVPAAIGGIFNCGPEKADEIEVTLESDLFHIHDSYFHENSDFVKISALNPDTLRGIMSLYESILNESAVDFDSHSEYRVQMSSLFGLILRAQHEVYIYMELRILSSFCESDIYPKLITDPSFANEVPATPIRDRPITKTFGRPIAFLDNFLKKRFSVPNVETKLDENSPDSPPLSRPPFFLRSISPTRLKSIPQKISQKATDFIAAHTNSDKSVHSEGLFEDYIENGPKKEKSLEDLRKNITVSVSDVPSPGSPSVSQSHINGSDYPTQSDEEEMAEDDLNLLIPDYVEQFEEALNAIIEEDPKANEDYSNVPISSEDEDTSEHEINSNHGAMSSFVSEGEAIDDNATKRQLQNLKEQIDIITQQEAVVDLMLAKSESNDSKEFRLLKKTKWQYQQELQALMFEKSQLDLKISDNIIVPGETTVCISSCATGSDPTDQESAKHFALYIIEVDARKSTGSGWIIARRYSEFLLLHRQLKQKYAEIMSKAGNELPGKKFLRHITSSSKLRSTLSSSFPNMQPVDKKEQEFLEGRRKALEQYLQALTRDPVIATSVELRHFLCLEDFTRFAKGQLSSDKKSSGNSFGRRLSSILSFDEGKKVDISPAKHIRKLSLQTVSLLDVLTQKLGNALGTEDDDDDDTTFFTEQIGSSTSSGAPQLVVFSPVTSPESMHMKIQQKISESMETPLTPNRSSIQQVPMGLSHAGKDQKPSLKVTLSQASSHSLTPTSSSFTFIKSSSPYKSNAPVPEDISIAEPLCDLFIEIFELKEKNNWLRRQAVQIVLQQFFGGAIERKFTENVKSYFTNEMWILYFEKIKEVVEFYGDPIKVNNYKPRNDDQKHQTKIAVFKKLHFLIPDIFGSMVGRANSKRGTTRLFDLFQNRRLNQEWQYRIFDAFVNGLLSQ